MATNNATNTPFAGSTGTGAFVGSIAPAISLPTIDNVISGYTTTATAAGTTTLTVSSNRQQFFTGSTTQTVVMPVTSTLTLGQSYVITNNSTGIVTVQSSGANTIVALQPGWAATITCILTSGTTQSSWSANITPGTGVLTLFTPSLTFGGGSTGITYSGQIGTYMRVGNLLLFSIRIILSNKGSSTGSAVLTGLPFTINATAQAYTFPFVGETITYAAGHLACVSVNNTSTINLYTQTTATILTPLADTNFANNSGLYVTGSYPI